MHFDNSTGEYVFEDRNDVIHELVNGEQRYTRVGFECRTCGRIHVRSNPLRLTPFTGKRRVPADVLLEVELVMHTVQTEAPICSTCGVVMAAIGKHPTLI